MRKATHIGECQVCGCTQMLPKGVLSLHGYDVRWGFFNGVCAGARHLPFELDKSLVDAAIKSAEDHRTRVREDIAKLKTFDPVATTAWLHLYRGFEHADKVRRSGYEWHLVTLTRTETTMDWEMSPGVKYVKVSYEFDNPISTRKDNLDRTAGYDFSRKTLAEVVLELNKSRVLALEGVVKGITTYIGWQKARTKDWSPKPLRPRPGSTV